MRNIEPSPLSRTFINGIQVRGLSSCGVARPIISDFHSDDPGSNPGPSILNS